MRVSLVERGLAWARRGVDSQSKHQANSWHEGGLVAAA